MLAVAAASCGGWYVWPDGFAVVPSVRVPTSRLEGTLAMSTAILPPSLNRPETSEPIEPPAAPPAPPDAPAAAALAAIPAMLPNVDAVDMIPVFNAGRTWSVLAETSDPSFFCGPWPPCAGAPACGWFCGPSGDSAGCVGCAGCVDAFGAGGCMCCASGPIDVDGDAACTLLF